jgi:hypothetical protein
VSVRSEDFFSAQEEETDPKAKFLLSLMQLPDEFETARPPPDNDVTAIIQPTTLEETPDGAEVSESPADSFDLEIQEHNRRVQDCPFDQEERQQRAKQLYANESKLVRCCRWLKTTFLTKKPWSQIQPPKY